MPEHLAFTNPETPTHSAHGELILENYDEATTPLNLMIDPNQDFSLIDMGAEALFQKTAHAWNERANYLHSLPEQLPTQVHNGAGLHFNKISLYHGSNEAGIVDFLPAEDSTIGKGLYATSMPDQAFGYAITRAKKRQKAGDVVTTTGSSPVVYEIMLADATFLDLRNEQNAVNTMKAYANYLNTQLSTQEQTDNPSFIDDMYEEIVRRTISTINTHNNDVPISLKDILQSNGNIFTQFVKSLGYDGIISLEGGEGGYTSTHDSWVIMEPAHANVTQETTFTTPLVFDTDTYQAYQRATDKSWEES